MFVSKMLTSRYKLDHDSSNLELEPRAQADRIRCPSGTSEWNATVRNRCSFEGLTADGTNNAISIIEDRIGSVIIMENDADWDVNIKVQLQTFALGVRALQGTIEKPCTSPIWR